MKRSMLPHNLNLRKMILAVTFVGLSIGATSCTSATTSSRQNYSLGGVDSAGRPVYAGALPIQNSYAFQQFSYGRQTEREKLLYLLSRIHQLKNYHFHYRGGRFGLSETYKTVEWIFYNWYKPGQTARDFLHSQFSHFERGGNPLLVEFPDGTRHHAPSIAFNELTLLEQTALL